MSELHIKISLLEGCEMFLEMKIVMPIYFPLMQ